jgi:hypothetical protein
MYTLYEALARDRMRADEPESAQRRVARHMAAARRWHRVETRARDAHRRYARRAR